MAAPPVDIGRFRVELESLFREVTVQFHLATSFALPLATLTIGGAPNEITVLFAQDAVIQAGAFSTEAPYGPTSFTRVTEALERLAREGYYARKQTLRTASGFGTPNSSRRVLTSVSPWPAALRAGAQAD